MKTWIRRTLIGLTGATVLLGGLAACGHRGGHAGGWSEERVAEMRGKAVERIGSKLDLDAAQRQKLDALADRIMAQRQAFRGEAADPRAAFQGLIAGETFDRERASQLLAQKTAAVQDHAPQVLQALADFYDSLRPEQQQQVREKLARRGHGWWARG